MRIKHKGLRAVYRQGNTMGVPAHLAPRLRRILLALDTAERPGNMALPGYRLHQLKGKMAGWWSVRVTGNWRVVFRFEDGKAVDVDFIDYHWTTNWRRHDHVRPTAPWRVGARLH